MMFGDMEPSVPYRHEGGRMIPMRCSEGDWSCVDVGAPCNHAVERAIEVPPDPSGAYDFRIEDTDGNLWPLTQQLKRLNDELQAYGLSAMLVHNETDRRVVLSHFVTLIPDPAQDSPPWTR